MSNKLRLTELSLKSFRTSTHAADSLKGGREIQDNPNPTIFIPGCQTGFTCGVCAYPVTIPNPNCYEDP